MLTLVVRVPDGYNRTAMATLRDGPCTCCDRTSP